LVFWQGGGTTFAIVTALVTPALTGGVCERSDEALRGFFGSGRAFVFRRGATGRVEAVGRVLAAQDDFFDARAPWARAALDTQRAPAARWGVRCADVPPVLAAGAAAGT
jgi:hypothetical protein